MCSYLKIISDKDLGMLSQYGFMAYGSLAYMCYYQFQQVATSPVAKEY